MKIAKRSGGILATQEGALSPKSFNIDFFFCFCLFPVDSPRKIGYIKNDVVCSKNAERRFLCLLKNVIFLTISQEVAKWILH